MAAATIEQRLRRLMKPGTLVRIDFSYGDYGWSASALPNSFHPIVAERQQLAFSTREDWTVEAVTDVRLNAMKQPVGRGHGKTMEDALTELEANIKKLVKEAA